MNTFQLECFLAVADYLNFARAAEHLHVTQPAVTQQIHSLEKELNVKLFHRTTRTVKITEEGKIFFEDARRMVDISRRARKRFENPDERKIQLLSIGSYSFGQMFLLAPVLRKLSKQYPNLHPRLQADPFQHLYRLLEEDDMDAVIGFKEPDNKKIPAAYREIIKVPLVCICSPDHPMGQYDAVTIDDLKEEKLVLIDPAKAQSDAAQLQGQLISGRTPADVYFCESAESAVVLVEAGFGISVLPELMIPPDLPLARTAIEELGLVSFGIYYKSLKDNEPLKSMLKIFKEDLSGKEPFSWKKHILE